MWPWGDYARGRSAVPRCPTSPASSASAHTLTSAMYTEQPMDIPYTVRRSSRARRVRVNVHAHAGVEVVLPARAPERAAASAVRELRPWIERRLAQARQTMAQVGA